MSDTSPTDANGAPLDPSESSSTSSTPSPSPAATPSSPSTPASSAPTSDPAPVESDTVTLVLVAPMWTTAVEVPQPDSDTLVVTRAGVKVPADQADRIIASAAASGVTVAVQE